MLNEFFNKSTILPGVAIIISGYLLNSASYYYIGTAPITSAAVHNAYTFNFSNIS